MAKKEYFETIEVKKDVLEKCRIAAKKKDLSILGVTDKFQVGVATFPDGVAVEVAIEKLPEGPIAEVAHWTMLKDGERKPWIRSVNYALDEGHLSFYDNDNPSYFYNVKAI